MKILKEESYRSKPEVNTNDDMIRVTFSCTKKEYHSIKKRLLNENDNISYDVLNFKAFKYVEGLLNELKVLIKLKIWAEI